MALILLHGGKDMLNIYTSYVCVSCKNQLVLLTEELDNMSKDKYLACPYCGCRRIIKQKTNNSLKECMSHSAYQRVNRAVRQVR